MTQSVSGSNNGTNNNLSVKRLLAQASSLAGEREFQDVSFMPALTVLVDSLNKESRLSPFGMSYYTSQFQRWLSNRLFVERYSRHKVTANDTVSAASSVEQRPPLVIIMGMPRTGSTKLLRAMSSTGHFDSLPLWSILYPAPLGDRDIGNGKRIMLSHEYSWQMRTRAPVFFAAHPMLPEEPEEELFALDMTFQSPINFMFNHAPSYRIWYQQQKISPVYNYLNTLISCWRHEMGSLSTKYLLLKSPMHGYHLDTVLAMYPDSKIIWCHRSPEDVTGSLCKLCFEARSMTSSNVEIPEVRDAVLSFNQGIMNNVVSVHREGRGNNIFHVAYRDIADNLHALLPEIFSFLGETYTAQEVVASSSWEKANSINKHGTYRYTLDDFMIQRSRIDSSFNGYTELFGDYL